MAVKEIDAKMAGFYRTMGQERQRITSALAESERLLFAQGASIAEIVEHHRRCGLERTYRQVCGNLRKGGFSVSKAVEWHRAWTDEEGRALERLLEDPGTHLEDVAKTLFRRTYDVRAQVAVLGLVYADPIRPAVVKQKPRSRVGLCDERVAAMSWGVPAGTGAGHWGQ